MISPRWQKVLHDVWLNKTRTVLVVLSIAVGVFAVGVIASTKTIVNRDLRNSYQQINPQSAQLAVSPFNDDMVDAIRRMPSVAAADGRRYAQVRMQLSSGQWKDLSIAAIPHYDRQTVNKIFPQSGAWPPGKKEILLERSSLTYLGLQVGQTITVETPDHKLHDLLISGTAFDVNLPPVSFAGVGYSYATMDTIEWLGLGRYYSTLNYVVSTDPLSAKHIQDVGNEIREKLKLGGYEVYSSWAPTPGRHPADDAISPMFLILQVMGVLTLLLSGFLVINTISAVLSEHIRQIGMMKAIGARRSQLVSMYFVMVSTYGLLALLVAAPLGYLGTRGLAGWLGNLLNLDITSYSIPISVFLTQFAIAMLVPLLSALTPVLSGTRITVREAISNYGVGKANGKQGLIDRTLERIRSLPRPFLLSLRNTFRRKGRLLRTLIVLTLGGAIFVSVFAVRASLLNTLDEALEYFNYDVSINFEKAQRIDLLQSEALQVPGVIEAESWFGRGAAVKHGEDQFSQDYSLIAPPPDTKLIDPKVMQGRWLLPDDENAVVLNTNVLKDEGNIKLGDEITLRIGNRETEWKVVGIVRGDLNDRILYVPDAYYKQLMNLPSKGSQLLVRSDATTKAQQQALAKQLEQRFNDQGMKVARTQALFETRDLIAGQFNIIVAFLLIMSVLLAVVGGLGLAGTMSINVLERTRETGVMRAIGASNGSILGIVIGEGMLVGVVSWVLSTLVALPLSRALSQQVGLAFLKSPLAYTFSLFGALLWLAVVVIVAALASYMPARRAARLSVREVLAYE